MDNTCKNIKVKDRYWQYVRGICIICVVLIHSRNGINFQNQFKGSWNFDYWLIFRQFINFPVAIFIFLAGYFINIEVAIKDNLQFILNRFRRLLLPFIMWSTFYTFIYIISKKGNIKIIKTFIGLMFGVYSGQLYFILVLLQLTLITPILIKIINCGKKARYLFLLTPLYLIALYSYAMFYDRQMPFYQTFFPAWFIFYYSGLWIKIKGYKPLFSNKRLLKCIIFIILSLLFSIIEAYVLLNFNFSVGFASSQIKISSFIYSFSIINILFIIKPILQDKFKDLKFKWVETIGNLSYGIYYIHMFFIKVTDKILYSLYFTKEVLPIFQAFQVILVISLSWSSIYLIKRFFREKFTKMFLGF